GLLQLRGRDRDVELPPPGLRRTRRSSTPRRRRPGGRRPLEDHGHRLLPSGARRKLLDRPVDRRRVDHDGREDGKEQTALGLLDLEEARGGLGDEVKRCPTGSRRLCPLLESKHCPCPRTRPASTQRVPPLAPQSGAVARLIPGAVMSTGETLN